MELPNPPQAVSALATFLRERLADVSGTIAPLLGRPGSAGMGIAEQDRSVLAGARQLATVIVGAAAPFAPTSYSRVRLIRQMHASGLLSAEEARQSTAMLELDAAAEPTASDTSDAPR